MRPASARASSSRSATSRRIRRDERRAEAAASRCSPSSTSSSSSRFASTEVSGVRSSCDASATNSRWRARVASVSDARRSSAWSIPSSVRASSATSSSRLGMRDPARGVAGALDRARGLGQLGDRGHRAPGGRDAGEQRQRRPAEHAEPEEEAHAVGGRLDVGEPARVLHERRRRRTGSDLDPPRLHPEARELAAWPRAAARDRARSGEAWMTVVVLGHDPDHGVLRARVGARGSARVAQLRLRRCLRRPRGCWSAWPAGRRRRRPAG